MSKTEFGGDIDDWVSQDLKSYIHCTMYVSIYNALISSTTKICNS